MKEIIWSHKGFFPPLLEFPVCSYFIYCLSLVCNSSEVLLHCIFFKYKLSIKRTKMLILEVIILILSCYFISAKITSLITSTFRILSLIYKIFSYCLSLFPWTTLFTNLHLMCGRWTFFHNLFDWVFILHCANAWLTILNKQYLNEHI